MAAVHIAPEIAGDRRLVSAHELNIAALLPAFLEEADREQFKWGDWDCLMMCARWAERVTGSHPVPELRGTYADAEGWRRIAEAAGGLPALLRRVAVAMGAEAVKAPLPGDVALVRIRPLGDEHLFGAIYVGEGRYAVKGIPGVMTGRMELVPPAYGLRG